MNGLIMKNSQRLIKVILLFFLILIFNSCKSFSDDIELSKEYVESGMTYFNQKKYDKALELFKKSFNLHPANNFSDCNLIGLTYKEMEDYNNAELWFKKGIEMDPEAWINYANLGDLYCKMNKYEEAITWYSKAKDINPKAVTNYSSLADIYLKLGNEKKAIEECKEAIEELKPYNFDPHIKLGDIYAEKGMYEKALSEWKAAKQDPYYKVIFKEYDPQDQKIKDAELLLKNSTKK